jgi:hypothetical protein
MPAPIQGFTYRPIQLTAINGELAVPIRQTTIKKLKTLCYHYLRNGPALNATSNGDARAAANASGYSPYHAPSVQRAGLRRVRHRTRLLALGQNHRPSACANEMSLAFDIYRWRLNCVGILSQR